MVNYCEDNDVQLLFASGWVVFDGSEEPVVSPASFVCPHSRYGHLKVMLEAYLRAASRSVDIRIVRLPGIFDSASLEPRFLRYFAECIRLSEPIVYHVFRNGSSRIPLLPLDAVIVAMEQILPQSKDLPLISHVGSRDASPTIQKIAFPLSKETGALVKPTHVDRTTFTGRFQPDVVVADGLVDNLTAICMFIARIAKTQVKC